MANKTVTDPRIVFFDALADTWDSRHNLRELAGKLDDVLGEFGVGTNETVLDVGCGTGNLTKALLRRLGPSGRVVAIDISEKMLAGAKTKTSDPRVSWCLAAADQLPIEDQTINRAICFSAWPHFQDPAVVTRELHRVLCPGGHLHILHLIPRSKVNRIHAEAHPSVHHDLLAPACETAKLLDSNRFRVIAMTDDDRCYTITANRQG